MLDRINAVRWSEYVQPQWNKPDSVVDALSSVARGEASAYDALLYAVGNNHAGTYYPVVLPVMPFLEEMVDTGNVSSQCVALDVLLDLFGSFRSEPGYEEIDFRRSENVVSRLFSRNECMRFGPCWSASFPKAAQALRSPWSF